MSNAGDTGNTGNDFQSLIKMQYSKSSQPSTGTCTLWKLKAWPACSMAF